MRTASRPPTAASLATRSLGARALAALALLAPLALPASAGDGKAKVGWGKESFTPDTLPERLARPAVDAIQAWAGWAAQNGYRFDIDGQARIVLVTPQSKSRAAEQLALVARTETWFDKLLPPGARATPATGGATGAEPAAAPRREAEEIPEDPEAPPPTAPKPAATGGKAASTWGSGGAFVPDSRTALFFVLDDEEDLGKLLDTIGAKHPELGTWTKEARSNPGFVIESPLCAAYVENAAGQEEWDPDHELVWRVARLLLYRRFGQQPLWFQYGLAWEAEMNLDGQVYVFPFRDEFVYTAEHGAWPVEVRNQFKDRAKTPLAIEEFARMPRGSYDGQAARLSWAFTRYLLEKHTATLPTVLEELRQFSDKNNRKATGGGKWVRDVDWDLPLDVQSRALTKHCGPDVLAKASDAFRKLDARGKSNLKTKSVR